MPQTRAASLREALEGATLEQLQKEAKKYQLPVTTNRRTLIEAIMTHLDRQGSKELPASQQGDHSKGSRTNSGAASVDEPLTTETFNEALEQMKESLVRSQFELQENFLRQQMEMQRQQQQFLSQMMQQLINRNAEVAIPGNSSVEAGADRRQAESPAGTSAGNGNSERDGFVRGDTIKWLATQIPEFGGSDSENINAWVRRVDRVAQIHGASDSVVLLAASSRLMKFARQWYELQDGLVIESWGALKNELVKMFERRIPFFKAMQKIEARKWNPAKESFDCYAIAKLSLMNSLDLPVRDAIHLLVGGITSGSLRATALSVAGDSVEGFLERMRCVTEAFSETEKKVTSSASEHKNKDNECRNCGTKGHTHKECRNEPMCFYCKKKGHRQYDCPTLKERSSKPTMQLSRAVMTVTEVTEGTEDEAENEEVAFVKELDSDKFNSPDPTVEINNFCGASCELTAIMDTGSPVSFVKNNIFQKFGKPFVNKLKSTKRKFVDIENNLLDVIGVVTIEIGLKPLKNRILAVELFVIRGNEFACDLILGREFLNNEKLLLIYEAGKISVLADDALSESKIDKDKRLEKRKKDKD